MAAAFMADPYRTIYDVNMAYFGFHGKIWPMLMADLSPDAVVAAGVSPAPKLPKGRWVDAAEGSEAAESRW
jgi:hypothetical protein